MKLVDSGEGKVPLISVLAILAISLTVNLPGLAISPVLGELKDYFKHTTPLQVQLLNVLPNLVTIPFILGSGKISNPKNQLTVLTVGLCIFLASGIGYFFAESMLVLIILSCLLGVGCGLLIPLAGSLISQNFSGRPRGTVLGTKSGLSNASVIVATLFVGWVAAKNWHLSFIVYFIPIIPLVMVPFIKSNFINKYRKPPVLDATSDKNSQATFHFKGPHAVKMMWGAIVIYFLATYATMAISYYLPFTMANYHLDTGKVGVATAMYYLTASLAGFALSKVIKVVGVWTMQMGLILATLGLFIVGFFHVYASYIIGILIMGFGYGLVQPILYDKTSYFAPTDAKSTQYFAYLLTFNYIGISSVPFIVEFFRLFIADPDPASHNFSYILNGVILGLCAVVCIIMHKSFVVQAGVIPEENGFVEEPSSVIAPGDRIVKQDDEPVDAQQTIAVLPAETVADDESNRETATIPVPKGAMTPEEQEARRQEHVEILRKESQSLMQEAEQLKQDAQNLSNEADKLDAEAKNNNPTNH